MEWIHYGRYLNERMQGKPTQYITGHQEFYGRDFRVTPDVLIPRPETELLVEAVLKHVPQGSRILDVGAGSGAIAITLALEGKYQVFSTDISSPALRIAAANAANLRAKVHFIAADLLTAIDDHSLDAVVSNPPYIAEGETLQREVRDWEPHQALFAGPDGLDIYRRLIPEAKRVLKPVGLLALELGQHQFEAVQSLAHDWTNPRLIPDLAGIPRVILIRKPIDNFTN